MSLARARTREGAMHNGTCERLGCKEGALICHRCQRARGDVTEEWIKVPEKSLVTVMCTHTCRRCLAYWNTMTKAGATWI